MCPYMSSIIFYPEVCATESKVLMERCLSRLLYFSFHSTMTTLSQTKELFRRADAVCFDVDSTVIKEEGIDELAKFCGVGDAVTEMYALN